LILKLLGHFGLTSTAKVLIQRQWGCGETRTGDPRQGQSETRALPGLADRLKPATVQPRILQGNGKT
tara:strand:- start:8 stop:208 length:201 start_codon:yes stop_codon:yes gene_type:complete